MNPVVDGHVDMPVKNTFIHFDVQPSSGGNGRRSLRRSSTEPSDPLPRSFDASSITSSWSSPLIPCGLPVHEIYTPISTAPSTPQLSPRCCTDKDTTASVPSDYAQSPPESPDVFISGMQNDIQLSPRCCTDMDTTASVSSDYAQSLPDSPDAFTSRMQSEPVSPSGAVWLQDCIPQTFVPLAQFTPAIDTNDVVFGLTLRLAEGVGLGLNVERAQNNHALIITAVRKQGGVMSWNRMVAASPQCMKVVVPGDKIVCVNGKRDCDGMLDEVRNRLLVKLTICRSGVDCHPAHMWWDGALRQLACQQWNMYGSSCDPCEQYNFSNYGIGNEMLHATLARI